MFNQQNKLYSISYFLEQSRFPPKKIYNIDNCFEIHAVHVALLLHYNTGFVKHKVGKGWTVVVAQMVQWSLLSPEICSLNQVLGNFIY